MKWTNNLGKAAIVGAAAVWLAGCASTDTAGGTAGAGSSAGSVTQGVNDPAVMAVVKSGKISGTPQQIAQLLQKRTFHYKTNEYSVTPADYQALEATAALMDTPLMQGKQLVIEGNTDERGTRSYNMALGLRRANSVKTYLEAKGVSGSQVRVISYGFEKPDVTGHNPDAWAKNRRVHLVIKGTDQSSHG